MGSGNMDTQTWFHSAETNVMVDSPRAVQEFLFVFRTNQDTERLGMIDPCRSVPVEEQFKALLGH